MKSEPGVSRLKSKWACKTKRTSGGGIKRSKARLAACGNEQMLGVFFAEFWRGVRHDSAKAILGIAWIWRTPARHIVVSIAYMRADKEDGVDIDLYIPDEINFTSEELYEYSVDTPRTFRFN